MIRMAAKLALKAVPKREKYEASLFSTENKQRQIEMGLALCELILPIKEELWRFYEEREITNLE